MGGQMVAKIFDGFSDGGKFKPHLNVSCIQGKQKFKWPRTTRKKKDYLAGERIGTRGYHGKKGDLGN